MIPLSIEFSDVIDILLVYLLYKRYLYKGAGYMCVYGKRGT